MRFVKSAVGMFLLLLALVCVGQQLSKRLTNQDVIDLAAVGLSDDVIIDKIHATEATDFDTSVAALKALKAAKVSDDVIRAMINPRPAISAVDDVRILPPATKDDGLPEEVGVYVELNGELSEVEPEIVGWQTGGVVKSKVTLGLDKGHVNGKIAKPRSPLQIPSPVVFVIKAPEGSPWAFFVLVESLQQFRCRKSVGVGLCECLAQILEHQNAVTSVRGIRTSLPTRTVSIFRSPTQRRTHEGRTRKTAANSGIVSRSQRCSCMVCFSPVSVRLWERSHHGRSYL